MMNDDYDHDMIATDDGIKADYSYVPFTKAERIQQLSDIDKSVTQLLKSAGLAIKTLTSIQSISDAKKSQLDNERAAFTQSTDKYLNELHSVAVRMKRQVNGLKEAGIIAKERVDDVEEQEASGFTTGETTKPTSKVNLDVGWLNTRSGKVGTDMETELWLEAKAFLEEREKRVRNASVVDVAADQEEAMQS